jgi:dipeptidyl-peptidase 4
VSDTFPRQHARTRRLTLGEPKAFRIAADGMRIVFLRSLGGSDPVNRLWVADRSRNNTWRERMVADPSSLFAGGIADSDLPPAERARRERLREQANGVTSFDIDAAASLAVYTLAGHLVVTDLSADIDNTRVVEAAPGAYDPRLSPDGQHIAYVSDRCLRVVSLNRSEPNDRLLAGEHDENVTWGVADFNAAEEFDRFRGFWWSPDSTAIAASRVDNTPVKTWYIADPANPSRKPVEHRYPIAGSDNAIVSLSVLTVQTGERRDVESDHKNLPYLLQVQWSASGLMAVWMNREQTMHRVLGIDPSSGTCTSLFERTEPIWIELTPGTPVLGADGSITAVVDTHVEGVQPAGLPTSLERDHYEDPERTSALVRVRVNGTSQALTPANLQIRRVIFADDSRIVVVCNASRPIAGLAVDADPSQTALVEVSPASGALTVLAGGSDDPGVADAVCARTSSGFVSVIRKTSVHAPKASITISLDGVPTHTFENIAEVALVNPSPVFHRCGDRAISYCVLMPTNPSRFGDAFTKLPVLLDPYGGPHAQRVVASRNAHASSQWFADQGFIVLVIDGRGTPGLGPDFERAIHGNFADPILEDQVAGLLDASKRYPQMDMTRVGIRGWSFGGYLAALAVLKRPDLFHAAVAGAPVTDFRLYDTGYTERYLGNPNTNPGAYERSDLLPLAKNLQRPLMLIHGLADDNVVAAHTLQLSSALLSHGRPHEVLPLSGVTHMTPQEDVAENLLKLQVDFLQRSLKSPVTLS